MVDIEVDMKPDRSLIDPQFDGYKLSLDALASYPISLDADVNVVRLSEKQYTYQHVKGFSLHNHLVGDPWNDNVVFFIDTAWKVFVIQASTEVPSNKPSCVLQLPDQSLRKETEGRVNSSLCLPSPDWAVLSDGTGRLFIARTHARIQTKEWQISYVDNPVGEGAFFTILHAVQTKRGEQLLIDCLLLHVDELETSDDPSGAQYITRVDWITFTLESEDASWQIHQRRTLEGYSSPDYAVLEQDGSAVLLASDKPFKLVYDSINPVKTSTDEESKEENTKKPPPAYTWTQEGDDITVTFTLPPEVTKSDVEFKLTHDHLDLGVKNGAVLLSGELEGAVDVEASTWTLEGQQLVLHLSKADGWGSWPGVVSGDTRGEMVVDAAAAAAIHERLAHLTSEQWNPSPESENPPYNSQELEACDAFPEPTSMLTRIDGNTHITSHQVNLAGHQWLFNVLYPCDRQPGICLRHDVDGLVWQPTGSREPGKSPWQHAATFNALGYVQASKQNKKFATSAPDHSYAVLADCQRHIYIYRQPGAIATPIRNRKTGRQVEAVAKQQVVSLDTMDDILGVCVTNTRLFILAGRTLTIVKVNEAPTV